MSDFFKKYNLDEKQIVEVDTLPLIPIKDVYIYYSDFENTTRMDYRFQEGKYAKNKHVYLNKEGELELVALSYDRVFVRLLLFLEKYRKSPTLLTSTLDNFDISKDKKEIKLKRMQIMLKPMKTLEDFKNNLNLATEKLPITDELSYFGDSLVFVDKKENLGSIIDIFGKESPYIKKWMKKFNQTRWEMGVIYNEEKNIYEVCSIPERSNSWSAYEKFNKKEYLFEYLLNHEIQAVG